MGATILVVDDENLIRWSLEKELQKNGYEVTTAASLEEARKSLSSEIPDLILLDITLPDGEGTDFLKEVKLKNPLTAVIMVTANDRVSTAVDCMKQGAFHYLNKPFEFDEVHLLIRNALEDQRLRKRIQFFQQSEKSKYGFENIIGESAPMTSVKNLIRQIAQSDPKTILIQGESGVGKDLIAKSIHYAGPRADKPFLSLNCAAIPLTIFESELFGHEKGAYTDARETKKGLVEEAGKGSLFLDEIGDMPKEMQAKLLRLIENRTYRRLGSAKEIETDVRIIAATNKYLKQEVEKGNFREDLFYRLNVIPLSLPSLRERKEDLGHLIGFFIAQFNKEFHKQVTGIEPEAFEILQMYDWPGNVRELKNVIERIMILNQETSIRREHLPEEIDCRCQMADRHKPLKESSAPSSQLPQCLAGMPLDAIEKHSLLLALEQCDGNQSKAAELLGIGRDAFRYKLQKYEILSTKG